MIIVTLQYECIHMNDMILCYANNVVPVFIKNQECPCVLESMIGFGSIVLKDVYVINCILCFVCQNTHSFTTY